MTQTVSSNVFIQCCSIWEATSSRHVPVTFHLRIHLLQYEFQGHSTLLLQVATLLEFRRVFMFQSKFLNPFCLKNNGFSVDFPCLRTLTPSGPGWDLARFYFLRSLVLTWHHPLLTSSVLAQTFITFRFHQQLKRCLWAPTGMLYFLTVFTEHLKYILYLKTYLLALGGW